METTTNPTNTASNIKPKVSAVDFFLHLGCIAAFYTFIVTLVSFLFSVVNTVFPDRQFNYYEPYGAGMRFQISLLLVVTPIFIILLNKIYKGIRAVPEKADFLLRKWSLYLTLTLSIIALAIDLVILINTFLGGEITTRFSLKALIVIALGGAVWLFTKQELKSPLALRPRIAKSMMWAVIAITILSIAGGVYLIGSPTTIRNMRDDDQRENDLSGLRYNVLNYYQTKNATLPKTLEDITLGNPYDNFMPVDPATSQQYGYKPLAAKVVKGKNYPAFELCATFAEDSANERKVQGSGRGRGGVAPMPAMDVSYPSSYPGYGPDQTKFSEHPAGLKCFEIMIDPDLYKPYPNPVR